MIRSTSIEGDDKDLVERMHPTARLLFGRAHAEIAEQIEGGRLDLELQGRRAAAPPEWYHETRVRAFAARGFSLAVNDPIARWRLTGCTSYEKRAR
jgi:hypothetical protein